MSARNCWMSAAAGVLLCVGGVWAQESQPATTPVTEPAKQPEPANQPETAPKVDAPAATPAAQPTTPAAAPAAGAEPPDRVIVTPNSAATSLANGVTMAPAGTWRTPLDAACCTSAAVTTILAIVHHFRT